jgi:hypothetical protein
VLEGGGMPGRGYWVLEGVGECLEEGVGCWGGGACLEEGVGCWREGGLLDWEIMESKEMLAFGSGEQAFKRKAWIFLFCGGRGVYLMAESLV